MCLFTVCLTPLWFLVPRGQEILLVLVTVRFLPYALKKKKRHPFVSVFWEEVEIAQLRRVQKGTSTETSFLVVEDVRAQLCPEKFLGLHP